MTNLEDQAHQFKDQTVVFDKDGEIAIKDSDGEVILEKDMVQSRLASLLYELTEMGKAKWIRRECDRNWFYCFVNNEKIEVEVMVNDDEDEANCLEKSYIIFFIHYRDAEFMYCGDTCYGDKILEILKSIPDPKDENDEKFQELNKPWFNYWQSHLLDDLTEYKNSLSK